MTGIQGLIERWDGLAVVARHDRAADAWVFIALHDPTLGTPVGGSRLKVYRTPEDGLKDAMRLAEGMTYKWAGIDFPFGGGKAVLCLSRTLPPVERRELLLRYGRLLETLNGAFKTGVDLGTTPEDMALLSGETSHVMGIVDGESRDPGPYTALGVLSGIRACLRHLDGSADLADRTVLVQGAGDVGLPLARLLAEAGARVLVADLDADRARRVAAETGGEAVAAEEIPDTPCDVYAPCAVGGVLDPDTIPRLRCRVVAGSANNQLESESDAERLHERRILYAPDYIINAGGAIAFGIMHRGEDDEATLRSAVERIEKSLEEIFAEAEDAGESPARAARRRAERVLARARAEGS